MSLYRSNEAERRIQDRLETAIANKHQGRIKKAIKAGFVAAANAYKTGRSYEAVLQLESKVIKEVLQKMYTEGFDTIAKRVQRHIADATKKSSKELQDDTFARARDNFIRTLTAKRVKQITRTSRDKIFKEIAAGIDAGEGVELIADRIVSAGTIESVYRAQMIARTEVHSAAQFGGLTAAKESKVVREKEWIPVKDDRTRDAHSNVASVPINQPFLVDGEELQYPGDPSGSPANIINCRCAMTYTVR